MKTISRRLAHYTMTVALTLCASTLALAEDIEIYIGGSTTPSEVKPNLTFIIDTSGSMSNNVTTATSNSAYDPATNYSGDCDTNRLYWSSRGTPPSCNTSRYILTTSNKCQDSWTALGNTGTGYYVTKAARYRARRGEDRWRSLSSRNHTDVVECLADFGVHGETNSSTKHYPADENDGGPWRNNSNNAINWNNTGRTYTFYSANYLNWRESNTTTVTQTRLEIVQNVFSNLMDSISNINVAVMRFDNKSRSANKGGYFIMPMQELTNATRADYKTAVNNLTPSGYTPLSEALYESYLFYRGDSVYFGNNTSPGQNVTGVLDPLNSGKYKSPIEYQCQKNFVILLTDGVPTYDTNADSRIEALPGFSTVTGAASCDGNCLDELADYMYTKDCSSLDDKQNVITYTIGFNTDQTLLSNAATKGGGKYYTADDTAGLTDVFTSILTEILAINTTFIAPAVSVNAFNRFTHRDELYYALFRPNARPNWGGNIKRFKLAGTPPIIVDANGTPAIDANTGFFKSTATSFWTPVADAPDGDEVKKGGAASMLSLPRTIYTYTSATSPNNVDLTATIHALHENNTAITKTMLGNASMTDTRRTDLLQWARGVDLFDDDTDTDTTDIRRRMADPLHTKPVLITYGGTDANPDMTLYAGTNQGHLQAINSADGTALFTFVPQELLSNAAILFDDLTGISHPYGLDGPLTSWINDENGNGVIYTAANTLETNEHAYIYQGMRRGGRNYYALDVTNRTTPTLKWMIQGGVGAFSELGQSWSAMTRAKIKLNGTDTIVLIFGGGYDTGQDSNTLAQDDTVGRAVFMVNAETGAKIWQAGPAGSNNGADPDLILSAMTNSIPSDIRVIDTDGDGYKDRLYVGDMRGQLWRFDIDNDNNSGASDLVTGAVIARLGGNAATNNRRFYYAPDASLSKYKTHINIAIGSGYRAHPLNKDIHDAFFIIRDKSVFGPALDTNGTAVYTTTTLSDLYDATANVIGEGTTAEIATAQTTLATKQGLYIFMKEEAGNFVGEKILAKSITFNGKVMFTTYTPVATGATACSPSQGSARAYLININDGTPVYDFNASGGDLTKVDRRMELVRGGIPPEPSIVFHENGPVILIGTEKAPDPGLLLKPRKIRWYIE
ncbi:MAG: pilus assembly protein PilY [Gammaproteobacteria bacterium]|nr:pilus assembly protein PilY [Gammaproteobacteria bacterium]